MQKTCPKCLGIGRINKGFTICPTCGGTGTAVPSGIGNTKFLTCTMCNGDGKIWE